MNTHEQWNNWFCYLLSFIIGGSIFCGYLLFADKTATSAEKSFTAKTEHQLTAPDFKISILGFNIFELKGKPQYTGVVVDLRIRNAGVESIATDWKLIVKTRDQMVTAEPMKPPPILTLTGPTTGVIKLHETDFLLEKQVASNVLKAGDPPAEGKLYFTPIISREKVLSPDTVIEITVSDFTGRTFSQTRRFGDMPTSDDLGKEPRRGPIGIQLEDSKHIKVYDNKMKGLDIGISVKRSEDVDVQRNKIDK